MYNSRKEKAAGGNLTAIQKSQSNDTQNAIDFQIINRTALTRLPALLLRWLPDGKCCGHEWIARNPRRADQHAGSFKINMHTGRWADFATGDAGGDVVSLAAYLGKIQQGEAARQLALMLGMGGAL
ncbi:MAG: hypothetical protein V4735_00920 [Pseudomonadota bacterium]